MHEPSFNRGLHLSDGSNTYIDHHRRQKHRSTPVHKLLSSIRTTLLSAAQNSVEMSLQSLNLSILSIPASYVLAFAPHSYAANLASGGNLLNIDNRSSRSSSHKDNLKIKLDAETHARYERAEAASANAYENLPILVAAILAGNMAGLPKRRMDTFAIGFLAVRAAYTIAYIKTRTQGWSFLRSALWATSLAMSFGVLYESAVKLA
jgi:uncharacterized MAPEG superfamily protein